MNMDELFKAYNEQNVNSRKMWEKASDVIPGGVSGNVKFFSPFPIFMKEGRGAYLTDVDNHSYIDYSLAYGPIILGHARQEIENVVTEYFKKHGTLLYGTPHEGEALLTKKIQSFYPSMEMMRFTSSGTEATLLAKRLAVAYTGRSKIAKFEGHYHGGYNEVLISVNPKVENAGNPRRPNSVRGTAGLTEEDLKRTIVLPFNDYEACEEILQDNKDEISCVLMEPLQGGTIPAKEEFIHKLRTLTKQLGILLIFDEVKTGFRTGMGGAQAYYEVKPDLTTLGKIIGAGLPIGVLGGRKDIMEWINPNRIDFFNNDKTRDRGKEILFHSGTYSGHPLTMEVGLKVLDLLENEIEDLFKNTEMMKNEIKEVLSHHGIKAQTPGIGAMFQICITDMEEITSYRDLKKCNFDLRRKIDYILLLKGIYNKPCTRYHLSTAHSEEVIEKTIEQYEKVLNEL